MTETTDPVWAFITALPQRVRGRLNRTERLVALIHRAVGNGWTIDQLVHETTRDHNGAINAGALVMHRLERCAEHSPDTSDGPRRIPFCTPECADNAGWVLDSAGMPAMKCPCRTHPEVPA